MGHATFDNDEQNDENQGFLSPSSDREDGIPSFRKQNTSKLKSYSRLTLDIAMALTIIILVIRPWSGNWTVKTSPVPIFPRKSYTFTPNPRYVHDNMFVSETETLHTLHNWIELSAESRGYVQISDYGSFDLSEPYTVRLNFTSDGPGYMMSVFHQLHCLSYIVQNYQTAFDGHNLTEEVAHHSAHCFDYLRQSILCAGDTNLEGKTEVGPGWGSKHQCVDYDALLAWANENSAYKWRNNMPDDSVL